LSDDSPCPVGDGGFAVPEGLTVLRVPAEGARQEREAAPYRGVIIIEWPAPVNAGSPYNVMAGCLLTVTDAVSGAQIKTCTDITIRANAEALVTADLTMLTDEDGEPLFGEPVPDGGGFRTATFPFLVGEMRVRARAAAEIGALGEGHG